MFAVEPKHKYEKFVVAHHRGYYDALEGGVRVRNFTSVAAKLGYDAGWEMGKLPQEKGRLKYWGQLEYWKVWGVAADREFQGWPYSNPHPLDCWQRRCYFSGARSMRYALLDD